MAGPEPIRLGECDFFHGPAMDSPSPFSRRVGGGSTPLAARWSSGHGRGRQDSMRAARPLDRNRAETPDPPDSSLGRGDGGRYFRPVRVVDEVTLQVHRMRPLRRWGSTPSREPSTRKIKSVPSPSSAGGRRSSGVRSSHPVRGRVDDRLSPALAIEPCGGERRIRTRSPRTIAWRTRPVRRGYAVCPSAS